MGPDDEARQVKRLSTVRARRDGGAVALALDSLRSAAADPTVNLMPLLLGAVRTYASIGEMMGALAGVFGRYVEAPRI